MSAETVPEGPFVSVAEFAKRSGISLGKAYALLRAGDVGYLPSPNRIPEAEVAAYLAREFIPARRQS